MRNLLIVLLFLGSAGPTHAQKYNTALGLRLTNDKVKRTVGLTLQQRILKKVTIEGIVQTDFSNNTSFHAIVERHHGLLARRLNAYVGAGLSLGIEQSELDPTQPIRESYDHFTFGADVIAGLEFTFLSYTLSLDFKPNFNFVGREPWYLGQQGFSVRKVLIKNISKERCERQKTRKKKKKSKAKAKQ